MKVPSKVSLSFLRKHGTNILLGIFFGFILIQRLPSIWSMYQTQGEVVQKTSVFDLEGQILPIPLPKKQVLIFWATWCGPCKVELERINKMIVGGEIPGDSVLAVSVSEDPKLVSSFAREREYRFLVAVDVTGHAATLYKVLGTPTIMLIDDDQKLAWMTTGISPSLELRIRSFFNK